MKLDILVDSFDEVYKMILKICASTSKILVFFGDGLSQCNINLIRKETEVVGELRYFEVIISKDNWGEDEVKSTVLQGRKIRVH